MAHLLFNLRHVPDDEADEIRALLTEHGIDFYETPPSFWGVSAGGIWLRDDERLGEAKRLLAEYQQQRVLRAREEPRTPKHPLQILFYLAIAAAVLYFSLMPFFRLSD